MHRRLEGQSNVPLTLYNIKIVGKGVELMKYIIYHSNDKVSRADGTDALNVYVMDLAEKQIKLAFEQSEKEVEDLRKRTSEGLVTAKMNGKQVGRVPGRKYESQKSKVAKERIRKISKTFEGNLSDAECIEMLNISRNSFYKYKAEMKTEVS